jgi:hypothetical protein
MQEAKAQSQRAIEIARKIGAAQKDPRADELRLKLRTRSGEGAGLRTNQPLLAKD